MSQQKEKKSDYTYPSKFIQIQTGIRSYWDDDCRAVRQTHRLYGLDDNGQIWERVMENYGKYNVYWEELYIDDPIFGD